MAEIEREPKVKEKNKAKCQDEGRRKKWGKERCVKGNWQEYRENKWRKKVKKREKMGRASIFEATLILLVNHLETTATRLKV